METLKTLLLLVHISAGVTAFISAFIAAGSKMLNASHQWHKISGRIFYYGMVGVFITTLPLSLLTQNIFLLMVGLFSFYLAFAGWCYAKNRSGKPTARDWLRAIIMLITAIGMSIYGATLLMANNSNGLTLVVFAMIGGGLSVVDLVFSWKQLATGANRIGQHLTMMLGASIAAITAFAVVNIDLEPRVIVWLAPTVVITPLIIVWNFKVRRATRTL